MVGDKIGHPECKVGIGELMQIGLGWSSFWGAQNSFFSGDTVWHFQGALCGIVIFRGTVCGSFQRAHLVTQCVEV